MSLPQQEDHGLEQDRLTNPEFAEISRLVYRHFGIVLGQEKRSLIISRLNSCLAKRRVGNFGEYILHVKQDRTGELLSELINQISTNFTSFYREPNHFAYFGNVALQEALADLSRKTSHRGPDR